MNLSASKPESNRVITIAITVAALGYFVDIYDLILFGVVRVPSLTDLGITGNELTETGAYLLSMQMWGMLLGGIIWGMLGDKKGRLSVLFGSILMYSVANIANGFVQTIPTYALLRFLAGIGLAGELGAGITLVSEVMSKEKRGYGTTLVAAIGIMGAVAAVLVGDYFQWRVAYFVGGGMGIALLILRIGIYESGMFSRIQQVPVTRGNFLSLFTNRRRFLKYIGSILIGIPLWYMVGILVLFSSEFGVALGMSEQVNNGQAIMFCYIGLTVGDLASGLFSQFIKSRKKAVLVFQIISIIVVSLYLFTGPYSLAMFYALCFAIGFGGGYWAVFVTISSEQFGTNIRATVTTTVPNFVRGSVAFLTPAFLFFRSDMGSIWSAAAIGLVVFVVAIAALGLLEETFGKDLDYHE